MDENSAFLRARDILKDFGCSHRVVIQDLKIPFNEAKAIDIMAKAEQDIFDRALLRKVFGSSKKNTRGDDLGSSQVA